MANKKNTTEISEYYNKKSVVSTYDSRRFSGKGGEYINETELKPLLSVISNHRSLKKKIKVNMLDLGAGRGRLSLPVKRMGLEVYCLDFSKDMLKVLKKNFPEDRLFFGSVFEKIKIKEKFQVISSLRFFDHFSDEDQLKILLNIKKNLEPQGVIVYACLNKISLEGLISSFYPYGRYNYFYTDGQYREMFRKAGLTVTAVESSVFFPRGIFLHIKNPSLLNFLIYFDEKLSRFFPALNALQVYEVKQTK